MGDYDGSWRIMGFYWGFGVLGNINALKMQQTIHEPVIIVSSLFGDEEMEQLEGSIFMSSKDIQVIRGCSLRTAQREHQFVRVEVGVTIKNLTVKAYCEFWYICYETVINKINEYR